MDYAEFQPPEPLRGLVKLAWTLSVGGEGGGWVSQTATPDGCIEIIHRLRGRSRWGSDQPDRFVAGLVTRPTAFEISDDSAFVALRLWPWAWNALAAIPSPALLDRWLPLDEAAPRLRIADEPEEALASLTLCVSRETSDLAEAILAAQSVADLAHRSGRRLRWLQRWFGREIGVAPRAYLRLLRFQETLTAMQREPASLADHAAAQGYADQAHMSREFRRLTGLPARRARQRASGPFV